LLGRVAQARLAVTRPALWALIAFLVLWFRLVAVVVAVTVVAVVPVVLVVAVRIYLGVARVPQIKGSPVAETPAAG